MDSRQTKRLKANESLREFTLRQTVAVATTLSSNLANMNEIAKDQNERLADQTALNLFEFAHKINPSLASMYCDTYLGLHMQEEVLRVEERMAKKTLQHGKTSKQVATMIASPPPQVTQGGSLTQLGDKQEDDKDEGDKGEDKDEYADAREDKNEEEYAPENLLYLGMYDEKVKLDLNK